MKITDNNENSNDNISKYHLSYGKAYRAIHFAEHFDGYEKHILTSLMITMDDSLSRGHNLKFLTTIIGFEIKFIRSKLHDLEKRGYITIQQVAGRGNLYSICQKVFDDYAIQHARNQSYLPRVNLGLPHKGGEGVSLTREYQIGTPPLQGRGGSPSQGRGGLPHKGDLIGNELIENNIIEKNRIEPKSRSEFFPNDDVFVSEEIQEITSECHDDNKRSNTSTVSSRTKPTPASRFLHRFAAAWTERYGTPHQITPRYLAMAKTIIAEIPRQREQAEMIQSYFTFTDPYILKYGHPLRLFLQNVSTIRAYTYSRLSRVHTDVDEYLSSEIED